MKYKYSIVIPHYNDIWRLERALRSIPLQRRDIQVLVVDDSSPDQKSLNDLKRKYKSVHWLSTGKKRGAGYARNMGLSGVKGQYLAFCDSDDEFVPDAFDIFDDATEQDFELYYFLLEAIQEKGGLPSNRVDIYNELCLNYLKSRSHEDLMELKTQNSIPCGKLYCANSISSLQLKFDETPVANDVRFNVLAALQLTKIAVVPRVTYRVYRREGSLTTNVSSSAFLTRLNVVMHLAQEMKKLEIKWRLSGNGAILKSLKFGPVFFLRVLWMVIRSELKVDPLKLFSAKRWLGFIKYNARNKKEIDKHVRR